MVKPEETIGEMNGGSQPINERLVRLRERWRSNGLELDAEGLAELDQIIAEDTAGTFTLERLAEDFMFRFSGVLKVKYGPNTPPEDYVLTEKEPGRMKLFSFPGGKIDPTKIPFTMYQFATFWKRTSVLFEHVLTAPASDSASLLKLLERRNETEMPVIHALERLAANLDQAFVDTYREIRLEGYRELEEEFKLPKISRRAVDDPTKEKPPVYVLNARPLGIFLDRYRSITGDQKKIFVSFNYQLTVVAESFEALDKQLRAGAALCPDIESIRWTSVIEGISPGSSEMYHNNVTYTLLRMVDLGLLDINKQLLLAGLPSHVTIPPNIYVAPPIQQRPLGESSSGDPADSTVKAATGGSSGSRFYRR